ncbi:transient receptor potential cation channel protein painless-like isoform X2 [Solenopsis invicta]|uniref:transient receptor potential cation channel protein painless-like isoform X2 n=1 Tax=Solenopsis invicta TaxID=13686 RepID=UPI00193CED21|nr:transient receptor potential cation channel protein painless-like isoform X2 [Solenopsis invicta]
MLHLIGIYSHRDVTSHLKAVIQVSVLRATNLCGFMKLLSLHTLYNKMDLEEDSSRALQERLLNVYKPTLNNAQVIYKLLLDALRSKDFYCFKNTIEHHLKKQPPILDINYVYPNTEETCLDTASRNGLKQFVEFLLRQGANPNRVNELHNRAPIHFATEGGHVDTLAALLTEPTINPNLQAGEQTALHIAVRMNDLTCTDLLLKNGASVNIPNSKGLTALHLAAKKDHLDILKLIMEKSRQRPDIDTYRDCDNWTIREVIQHKIPSIVLPPKYENREVNVDDLKYYLIANDEINFLESMKNVKIEDLHSIAEELLEMTALRGFHKAAIGILEKLKGRQFSVKKAMQAAVQQSDRVILQELLKIEPNMANDLILNACQMLGMPKKQRVDNTHDQLECLKLILEQENVNVRCNDNKGNTPLHYAISSGCQEAMILLLDRGSYIGHMNKFNIPPIADISTHTLSRYFDDCLQTRKDRTNECTIEFNYRCLMPHNVATEQDKTNWTTHEMEVFKYIAGNSGLKPLLKHPLLSSFLYLKWYRIRHILYANFVFYIIFYLLLNVYIFNMTYDIRRENETQIANESVRISKSTLGSVLNNFLWGLILGLITIMLLLFILREIFQLISCVSIKRYLIRNWLEIILIIFTVAALCGAGLQIDALVFLLSACELVILINQHPRLSTGIEMFRMVSFNFIRFLLPYLFLIFAFALAFYTLFKDGNDTNFHNLFLSIFKTVIMLTGEFDANDIPFISHPIWSHIVFMLFVFFIVIVLFNLLNGLAVSDIAEILSKAELVGLVSRIRLLAYIEEIVVGKSFRHCFCSNSRWNLYRYLAKRILLFPHFLKDGKIIIKPCDNSDAYDNDLYYEKDIHSESIKCDQQWNTSIMDPDIIKQAKRIIRNKNQTGNEKIIAILNKLQDKGTTIEIILKTTKFTEE